MRKTESTLITNKVRGTFMSAPTAPGAMMDKPAARKGDTERRLIAAATELFAHKWYNTVSVAEICRAAGLSNGIFYKYFDGKETLFRRILETVIEGLKEALGKVQGDSPRARLHSFAEALFGFTETRRDLISVFREGQYRFFEYERRLVELYSKALAQALGRDVGIAEYLFALGGIRFCAVRRCLHGIELDPVAVKDILCEGLFKGLGFDPEAVFGGSVRPLPIDLDSGARERLLKAGKRLFGEKGFFETNIHEITDAAGLSVGAFYAHFEGKESFYAELIDRAGHEVRAFIQSNLDPSRNRLERELRGIWLFLVFLSIDKHCYAIVREAEFVLPASVREYYGAFVAGYKRNPDGNGEIARRGAKAEQAAIEYLLGISHYFGIEVAFDDSPSNARGVLETLGKYLAAGFGDYL
jgi:AcrR family transcriptional regulator